MEEIKMDRIEDAIADFKEVKFVIVVDDPLHILSQTNTECPDKEIEK